jgi:hypothetical protein
MEKKIMPFTGTKFKFVNVYAKNKSSATRKAKQKVSSNVWRVHSVAVHKGGTKRHGMYPSEITFAKRKKK